MSHCRHATHASGGTHECALGLFGGRPHIGVCLRRCPHADSAAASAPRPRPASERKPCPDPTPIPELDAAAQAAVDRLAAAAHPHAALYAERLAVARGLAFTDCARRTRLRAIIADIDAIPATQETPFEMPG